RVGPPQLRQGGRRFTPFGLPEEISERFGNSGRAAAAVNLQPLRSEPDWHSAKRFVFTFWSRRPQGDGYSFAHEDVDLSFVDLVNCSHGGFDFRRNKNSRRPFPQHYAFTRRNRACAFAKRQRLV